MKKIISDKYFDEERALFKAKNLTVNNCTFNVGESPLKESKNIEVVNSTFQYKYPFWYSKKIYMHDCILETNARAGIWYTKDSKFVNFKSNAPKLFRKCKNIIIEDVEFNNATELLWWNDIVKVKNIKSSSDYIFLGSKRIYADNLYINGLYAFDGISNSRIINSHIITKDAFWNSSDVIIENSYIECEYFGWNSKNITLINCEIKSHQGFCYMDKIKLVNCKVSGDLMFEYCTNIDANILNVGIESIKNPTSGKIIMDKKCDFILDETDEKLMKIIY